MTEQPQEITSEPTPAPRGRSGPAGRKLASVLVFFAVVAVLVFTAGFFSGISPMGRQFAKENLGRLYSGAGGAAFELQDEVLQKLEQSFYQQVDAPSLEDDAVEGMVEGLGDPYTMYLTPKEYADLQEHTEGEYSGVGMAVESKGKFPTVITTFKGTPAEQAGIRPGDIILMVDGTSTQGLSLDEVVAGIKGQEGTKVTLRMYRAPADVQIDPSVFDTGDPSQLPAEGTVEDVSLTRKAIQVPVVETEIIEDGGRKVAHVVFSQFSADSSVALREEVRRAVEDEGVAAVVLDLRGNGGGLLNEAVAVASIFMDSGVVVVTEGLHSERKVYEASGNAYSSIPLVVLVDEYTASASEIVAGAIQDSKRGILVGETTFGKGLVQTVEPLSNGGALKVTTAVYLTPAGRDINETGITPDVVAPDKDATSDVDETLQSGLEQIRDALGKE